VAEKQVAALGASRQSRINTNMAPRKRKKKFTAAKEAKRVAREVMGRPPAQRVIANKRRKPPKHKKPLIDEAAM